jgi:hypothetical protein
MFTGIRLNVSNLPIKQVSALLQLIALFAACAQLGNGGVNLIFVA